MVAWATKLTIGAEEMAEAFGCSTWQVYELVKRGECPVEPIHVGRKLRWPTAAVLRKLAIEPSASSEVGSAS